MLPEHVNIILLSATVPNTREFADWVGSVVFGWMRFVRSCTMQSDQKEGYLRHLDTDATCSARAFPLGRTRSA
jgi:replicative superfamily II helicase